MKIDMSLEDRVSYLKNFDFPFCEVVSKYEATEKIGQGTFGEVFQAREKTTGKLVALKKVLMDNEQEGFPITTLREIKILQLLNHENVVSLLEICRTKAAEGSNRYRSTFYLVFDLCDHDLSGLLSNARVKIQLPQIKSVMKQLFNALYYIHTNKILHRDIKAANILITKEGIVKLADFGLARAFSVSASNGSNKTQHRYTNRVVTLWYRPPELLLGERNYGPSVDMWGAGCIMAEMFTRSPILQGNTEQHQLNLIAKLCGSLTPDVWEGCEHLPLYKKLNLDRGHKRKINELLNIHVQNTHACDLLDKLLTLDPSKRINANDAIEHDFFWSHPDPVSLEKTLRHFDRGMYEYLKRPVDLLKPKLKPLAGKNKITDSYYDRVF